VDPSAALIAGLVAGLAIAMQVGAVSVMLVESAVVAGVRAGVAAGMGVATVDCAFGAVAAAAGGAVGAALSSHETEFRLFAALALAAIAVYGLIGLRRGDGDSSSTARQAPPHAHYARFVAVTAANPLTIASFAAVAASLSLDGPGAAAAFAAGVGVASAGWHLALSLAAGHARRRVTPRMRRGLAIGGRLVVLAIAAHLALVAI
jgi:threonine/homoserine/homoserine lactone efflux protein